jgi:putative ABC transport system substrate-binding protein
MMGVGDPIGAGLVSNLAQPGRNITGTSLMLRETQPKVLEILKEAIPGLKRVAILHVNERWIAHAQATASRFGIETHAIVVRSAENLPQQLGSLAGVEAIWVLADPYIDEMRSQIADLAIRHRLPSMGPLDLYAEAGFLFSYSANLGAMHGRAAYYVDRILRGARPGELPIEQPAKFEMIVNLKTARSLRFTVPAALLVRADRIIE